jgi:3-oxoacyl-[acyl-carrier-protein] synthase III
MADQPVGLAGMASYLPRAWMSAAELAAASGIPETVFVERFGLRGKHIAGEAEHVTDLARAAARRLLAEQGTDPEEVDAVVYFGSTGRTSRSGRPRRGSPTSSAASGPSPSSSTTPPAGRRWRCAWPGRWR